MSFLENVGGLREELLRVNHYMREFLPAKWEHGVTGEIIQAVMEPGGKQLRPRMLLLAGRFGPDYPACRERLCKLAALVELVHLASLVHDDIVDDAPLRRGRPSIQARFGKNMAVYTGDLILGRVMRILFQEDFRESGLLLGRTIEDMCRSEVRHLDCRYRVDGTIADYMGNIYGKTASMFVTACRAGGIESGCEEKALETLGSFGEQTGYLFQLRDDLMDFVSEEEREGKPVHLDFREGIFTLPVLHALGQQAYKGPLQTLASRAAVGLLNGKDMELLARLVRQAGGIDRTVQEICRHRSLAVALLEELPEGAASAALAEIVERLSESVEEVWSSARP